MSIVVFPFDTWPHCVASFGPVLSVFLPQPPQCCDYLQNIFVDPMKILKHFLSHCQHLIFSILFKVFSFIKFFLIMFKVLWPNSYFPNWLHYLRKLQCYAIASDYFQQALFSLRANEDLPCEWGFYTRMPGRSNSDRSLGLEKLWGQ
jgi:hypothetical protein